MVKALKGKDIVKAGTLRLLKSAIKNEEISQKRSSDDEMVLKVLAQEAKKRKDAMAAYKKGGRQDLVDQEQQELDIITQYLPEQMGEEEVRQKVKEQIEQIPDCGPTDMGKIMGMVMKELKGKADGAMVKKVVQGELSKLKE